MIVAKQLLDRWMMRTERLQSIALALKDGTTPLVRAILVLEVMNFTDDLMDELHDLGASGHTGHLEMARMQAPKKRADMKEARRLLEAIRQTHQASAALDGDGSSGDGGSEGGKESTVTHMLGILLSVVEGRHGLSARDGHG